MDRFARVVLGYHGCEPEFAEALIRGEISIDEWRPSANDYDWLGRGIYFWEFAPERAQEWSAKKGAVGAVIQLGRCLDFTDVGSTKLLNRQFEFLQSKHASAGETLPTNRGKRRDLDCLVINELILGLQTTANIRIQTLRCPFLEGSPAFPGSGILLESHVQVVVLDKSCILGVFRPQLIFPTSSRGGAMNDWIYQALDKALKEQEKIPAREWYEGLIARGAIDRQGRVLLRYPIKPDDEDKPEEPCVCQNAIPVKSAAPGLNGIVETALYVEDLERSGQFYETVLGFPVISSGDRVKALAVSGRPQTLLLCKAGASIRSSTLSHDCTGQGHLAFAIDAGRLEAWEKHLEAHGVAIEEKRQWELGGWSLYFRDPDKHLIELATPGVWSNY